MGVKETLNQLENLITQKIPLSPAGWLDIIGRVVVEMGSETDNLYALQKKIAQNKVILIQEGKSVAEARSHLEATDLYEQMQRQRALCHKIEELVRIGKLQSKLKGEEYSGGNLQ